MCILAMPRFLSMIFKHPKSFKVKKNLGVSKKKKNRRQLEL